MAQKRSKSVYDVPGAHGLLKRLKDGWYYRRGSSSKYPWIGPFSSDHVARQVRDSVTGGPWGLPKERAHATMRGCPKCGPHHAAIRECATWDPGADIEPLTEAKRQAASEYERCYLVNLMQRAGTVSAAARLAKLDRSNFKKLLHRHGMRVPKE